MIEIRARTLTSVIGSGFIEIGNKMKKKRACVPCLAREEYIRAENLRGIGKITTGIKNRYVDEFVLFCMELKVNCPVDVTSATVKKFSKHVLGQNNRAETSDLKVTTVQSWLEWCSQNGFIDEANLRKKKSKGKSSSEDLR